MKSSEKFGLLFNLFLTYPSQLYQTFKQSFVKYYENEGISLKNHSKVANILAFSIYYGARLFLWIMFSLCGCIVMNLITDKFNLHFPPFF